jgi:Baseplate J-like protein
MSAPCARGCCEGIRSSTPEPTANRPGLDRLRYRVGTHASFFDSMKAALSSGRDPELETLTTRAADDASIALLDAWATVADVLTFYQERIANEGYLRTATERRSVLELGRLVGYELRPGVAASAYLAYTLQEGYDVEVPAGARSQSLPGPEELPQPFETSSPLQARAAWNNLEPRKSRPQQITRAEALKAPAVYLKGTSVNVKANDRVLLVFDDESAPAARNAIAAETDAAENRTRVFFEIETEQDGEESSSRAAGSLQTLLKGLKKPPATHPASAVHFRRDVRETFGPTSDVSTSLLTAGDPLLKGAFYAAWGAAQVTPPPELKSVDPLRIKASLFGHNVPLKPIVNAQGGFDGTEEWPLLETRVLAILLSQSRAAGRMVDIAAQGRAPLEVRLGVGDDTVSAGFLMAGEQPTVSLDGVDVSVALLQEGGPRLEINFAGKAGNRFGVGPRDRVILFDRTTQGQEGGRDVAIGVRFEWGSSVDPERVVREGQSVRYRVGSRRVAIEFRTDGLRVTEESPAPPASAQGGQVARTLPLDNVYDSIVPKSLVLIERRFRDGRIERKVVSVDKVASVSKTGFGVTAKVTQLTLAEPWLDENVLEDAWLREYGHSLEAFRNVTVFAQNEAQTLIEEPIVSDIGDKEIELQGLYDGLESGRWLIVSGERTDVPLTSGVRATELVMLAGVKQDVERRSTEEPGEADPVPGSKTRSTLELTDSLAYTYKRDTVKIYGNVVKATHGETREEILGSGDGSKAFQAFTLKQPPLTYVAAANPSGVESTLDVRVNQVTWHSTRSLVELGPKDRAYMVRTDDEAKTTVIFGDGERGARLPSGLENVTAVYRNGIGKGGNVRAEQISLLVTRPLGVKEVTNPQPATGGADAESRDEARRNVPVALLAMDRLVSVQDYEDFARTFAGVGKAKAVRLSDGQRELVHLTIAGADDIPIDESSDLYRSLNLALREFGDPRQAIVVQSRELLFLIISARVRLVPDYHWEAVEPEVRRALLDAFSFERRELGQDVFLSEVIAVIQAVPGVECVDVDVLDTIAQSKPLGALKNLGRTLRLRPCIPVELAHPNDVRPAQLAVLPPEVPDSLILHGPEP